MDITLLTRGGGPWGLGHLHRTAWLAEGLAGSGSLTRPPAIRCLDTAQARAFWETRTQRPTFLPDIDAACADLTGLAVFDWLDNEPTRIARLRDAGVTCVLLDDYGPAVQEAALSFRSLLAALEDRAEVTAHGRLLSGPQWLLLAPAVTRLRGSARSATRAAAELLTAPLEAAGEVRTVLLSFGGAPQVELISRALAALARVGCTAGIVVMPGVPSLPPPAGLHVEQRAAGDDFAELLAGCDLLVCAGGQTLYEAAFLGVPALCISLNSHQLDTGRKLEAAGACLLAGPAGRLDWRELDVRLQRLLAERELRGQLSAAGQRLTDGAGLQRTVAELLELGSRRSC